MAGNSSRKGAIRQSKKGPSAGTGGNNKRRLEGKGPTPKAEDRPYHAAAKRKKAAEKKETRSPRMPKGDRPRGEIVAGRNAVLEALRENVPATELLVARSIDVDDRVAESLKHALHHGLPIREAHRAEVEGISPNSQIGLRAESGVHGPKQDLQWGISLLYKSFAPWKATKEAIVRILVTWGQVLKAKLGNIIRSANKVELYHQLGGGTERELFVLQLPIPGHQFFILCESERTSNTGGNTTSLGLKPGHVPNEPCKER